MWLRFWFASFAIVVSFGGVRSDERDRYKSEMEALTKGIANSKSLKVYEGVTRGFVPKDKIEETVKEFKLVKLHDHYFYPNEVEVSERSAGILKVICKEPKNFSRRDTERTKFCGGYHPDWCVEFQDGKETFQVLICFSCHEAKIYGPKNEVYCDFPKPIREDFGRLLEPLFKHRKK